MINGQRLYSEVIVETCGHFIGWIPVYLEGIGTEIYVAGRWSLLGTSKRCFQMVWPQAISFAIAVLRCSHARESGSV